MDVIVDIVELGVKIVVCWDSDVFAQFLQLQEKVADIGETACTNERLTMNTHSMIDIPQKARLSFRSTQIWYSRVRIRSFSLKNYPHQMPVPSFWW